VVSGEEFQQIQQPAPGKKLAGHEKALAPVSGGWICAGRVNCTGLEGAGLSERDDQAGKLGGYRAGSGRAPQLNGHGPGDQQTRPTCSKATPATPENPLTLIVMVFQHQTTPRKPARAATSAIQGEGIEPPHHHRRQPRFSCRRDHRLPGWPAVRGM